MVIEIRDEDECIENLRVEIVALAKKVPGFNGFTGFNIGVVSSDMILPMEEFMTLYKNMVSDYFGPYEPPKEFENFTHSIPKTKLFVSL